MHPVVARIQISQHVCFKEKYKQAEAYLFKNQRKTDVIIKRQIFLWNGFKMLY